MITMKAFLISIVFAVSTSLGILPASTPFSVMAAHAETATFVTPVSGNAGDVAGLPDGVGVTIAPGETVGLLLSSPFALFEADGVTPVNNAITIFTLSDVGSALGRISFGRYNNGSPTLFHTDDFSPGTQGANIDFNFLAFVGCGDAGGCDYIQISAVSAFNGSSGVTFDAVQFKDVPLASVVTGTAPEPATWLLMIAGFLGLAWRMKARRSDLIARPARRSRRLPSIRPLKGLSYTEMYTA